VVGPLGSSNILSNFFVQEENVPSKSIIIKTFEYFIFSGLIF